MITNKKWDRVVAKNFIKVFFNIFVVWIWCVLLAIVQGGEMPFRFVVLEMLLYTGMMVFLLSNFRINIFSLKLVLYLIILFFYYQYFIIGTDSYGIMGGFSGAINTVVLLSIAITIQVIDYRDNKKIAILPAILIVPIAILSWNRTGLVTSLLYLIVVLYVGSYHMKKRNLRPWLYFFITTLIVFVVVKYWNLFLETDIYEKIEEHGVQMTGRDVIWAAYFKNFGIIQFFLGRAIDSNHLLAGFDNAHNSFIFLHAQTGIWGIVFMVILLKWIREYLKGNLFIFLLFVILIFRSFFDMMFFFHAYDFAFFIFIVDRNMPKLNHRQIELSII